MITLYTLPELRDFLKDNEFPTLVGKVVFTGDLLDYVLFNDNSISIDANLGFVDDGGEIAIDYEGNVVRDLHLP